jgi:hypothetical protein
MMLQRNLLYTRVTWARKLIVLAGGPAKPWPPRPHQGRRPRHTAGAHRL